MYKEVKRNVFLAVGIIVLGLIISSGVYAWLSNTINVTNGVQNIGMKCFLIDYNVNNVSGGQDITGTMFPSENASGGLTGRVGLKTNSNCNINGEGSLKLHVNAADNALLTNSSSYCESRKTMEPIRCYTSNNM